MNHNSFKLPEHYFVPCTCLCIYFDSPPHDVLGMFAVAAEEVARSSSRMQIRSQSLWQTRPAAEILVTRRTDLFSKCKVSSTASTFAQNVHKLTGTGKLLGAWASIGETISFSDFEMYHGHVVYECDEWENDEKSNWGGSRLVLSFVSGSSPTLSGFVSVEFLERISSLAQICHGVIDTDYYIANRHGQYYTGPARSPHLSHRERASIGWTQGGASRKLLCRDPREALLLGRELTVNLGLHTDGGVSKWRARHDLESNFPEIVRLPGDLILLKCTPDPADFNRSIRMSSHVRDVSEKLFSSLCSDHVSSSIYKIGHSESLDVRY